MSEHSRTTYVQGAAIVDLKLEVVVILMRSTLPTARCIDLIGGHAS
jgi:hypothetical protein